MPTNAWYTKEKEDEPDLSGMKKRDEEIDNLVKDTIKKAKQDNKNEDMATRLDEKIAADEEKKALTKTLSDRIMRKSDPYTSEGLVNPDVSRKVRAFDAFHDAILQHEITKDQAREISPALDKVVEAMSSVVDQSGMGKNLQGGLFNPIPGVDYDTVPAGDENVEESGETDV